MSRLICLEKADYCSDYSSHEENEALRDEIGALREEVTILRRTNVDIQICHPGKDPASQSTAQHVVSLGQDSVPPEIGPTSSARNETGDQEDELCPLRDSHALFVTTTTALRADARLVLHVETPAELRPVSSMMTRRTPTQTNPYQTMKAQKPLQYLSINAEKAQNTVASTVSSLLMNYSTG